MDINRLGMRNFVVVISLLAGFLYCDLVNATVYRGSTHTRSLNITVDPTDSARWQVFPITLPEVYCFPDEMYDYSPIWDCRPGSSHSILSTLSNAALILPASSSATPTWNQSGKLPFNLALHSKTSNEIYLVEVHCSFLYINGSRLTCNSGYGYASHAGTTTTLRTYDISFSGGAFSEVPDGEYTAVFNGSVIEWHQRYLLLNLSVMMDFTVSRSDGSNAISNGVQLHDIQGSTLPINFVQVDERNQYGVGSLDFCLEATNYSNISMYVVGQDFSYPDSPQLSIYDVRSPGVFVLANRSGSVTDAKNAIIPYAITSRTLGMTNPVSDNLHCSSTSFGFCSSVSKNYDFSYLPDTPSPTGGLCKRFDISVVTSPFSIYRATPGDYSSSFYLNIDEVP